MLGQGEQLEPLRLDGLPLLVGESAYAEIDAEAWRWLTQDVVYERRSLLLGGSIVMTAGWLASCVGNHRRRLAAERSAAAQWRPLGLVRVVATDLRLLVWHAGTWWSVWYNGIAGCHLESDGCSLVLVFDREPPYRICGASVAILPIVLVWISDHEEQTRS